MSLFCHLTFVPVSKRGKCINSIIKQNNSYREYENKRDVKSQHSFIIETNSYYSFTIKLQVPFKHRF